MPASTVIKNIEDFPAMLSGLEVADLMRISRPTAYKLIKEAEEENGWFPVFRIGSSQKNSSLKSSPPAVDEWFF